MTLTRRAALSAFAIGGAALAAPHQIKAASHGGKTFCLVHGAWHGGWAWGPTVDALRAMGHTVTAPDLPGMGDRRAEASAEIGLADHTTAIRDHLFMRDLTDVVLVAHSYAGCILSDLLGQGEDRIAHAVYFDALVPGEGQGLASFVPEGARAAMRGAADAGQLLPVRPKDAWEELWGLTGDLAAFAEPRFVSHPPRTFLDVVTGDPFAREMPRTFIKSAQNPNPLFKGIRADIEARGDFTVVDIAGHHDVMAINGPLTADTLVSVAS
ncbi:MAG: alpha/beta fold hydrolase [Pseudomonadota bacterium]